MSSGPLNAFPLDPALVRPNFINNPNNRVYQPRNDIVYVDGAGSVWNNAAADRVAVVNTPGGGASRSTRRPDLVPGVDPFIVNGGLLFLNPAAFSTPRPGTFGNLERNSIHR